MNLQRQGSCGDDGKLSCCDGVTTTEYNKNILRLLYAAARAFSFFSGLAGWLVGLVQKKIVHRVVSTFSMNQGSMTTWRYKLGKALGMWSIRNIGFYHFM